MNIGNQSIAVSRFEKLLFFPDIWAYLECLEFLVSLVKNQLIKLAITSGSCILAVLTSVVYLAKMMDRDPDLAFAYSIQGIVQAELVDDRQGAIDSYSQAIQLQPDRAISYYFRAKTRYKSGNNLGAIDDYNKAIQLQPDYVNAYISRGVVRAKIGNTKDAIDDYNRAIALKPDYANSYYNRGIAKSDLGDRKNAIDDFNKAAELFKKEGKTRDYQEAFDRANKLSK
jgi:tetratricopeptide (TPR) repeat protein